MGKEWDRRGGPGRPWSKGLRGQESNVCYSDLECLVGVTRHQSLCVSVWLHGVFDTSHRLSLVVARGAALHGSARASHCRGISCFGAQAPGHTGSVVAAPPP